MNRKVYTVIESIIEKKRRSIVIIIRTGSMNMEIYRRLEVGLVNEERERGKWGSPFVVILNLIISTILNNG